MTTLIELQQMGLLPTVEDERSRRRFEAAKAAMQGLLASGKYERFEDAAFDAVSYADALLAELDKEAKP